MPGEWQEPQRWVSSTRNRLQLKESRKYDAAVKWPRWLPCLHAPEKVPSFYVLGPAVAFFSQLSPSSAAAPSAQTLHKALIKHFPNCGQGSHTLFSIV